MPQTLLHACAQLACLLMPVFALQAQHALTLDEVLATALRDNPDLRAARARTDSARAEVRIARAYPNPVVNVAPQNPYQYMLAAPLDLGPQRTYRVRSGQSGAAAAALDHADVERQLRFLLRQAFYDLVLADSSRDVTRDERDIFRDLLKADSARFRAGDAPARNVGKSELELAKAEAALTRADALVRSSRLLLQALMGVANPDTGFRVDGTLSVSAIHAPAVEAGDSALARRPDVGAARHRTDASEDARRLATAEFLPVPGLTLVQQRDGPFPNGQHYALGFSVQLPVWNWFTGERSRAAASLTQSRVAEEKTRLTARTEIITAADQVRSTAELARRYDAGLLEKARRALDDSRYAYRAGAIAYVDLLDAIRTWGQVRADALTAAHDYLVSVSSLSRATGKDVLP